jgi:pyruvate/2-oxoglutarate dehydrogenase complex dihydrolipoamide dehydrogenase (E3) component
MGRVVRAIKRSATSGIIKVVIDADTDRILGAGASPPHGPEARLSRTVGRP